jgi:hypothetical protein
MSRDNKTARQFLRQKPLPTGKSRFVGIARVIDAGCGSAAKPESSLTR